MDTTLWRILAADAKTATLAAHNAMRTEAERRSAKREASKSGVLDALKVKKTADAMLDEHRANDPDATRLHKMLERDAVKASAAYKRASRRVPDSMPVFTAKVAGALTLGGLWVPDQVWEAAGYVGLPAAATLWAGSAWLRASRRKTVEEKPEELVPTEEEAKLLERLDKSFWSACEEDGKSRAAERGLAGLVPGKPVLTETGITCRLRMEGTWSFGKVHAHEDQIRALLDVQTSRRVHITPGTSGSWVTLTIRTRTAVDEADMSWTPVCKGIGLCTETGEPVVMPTNERMLFAGSSGSGKSTTLRPLLADIVRDELSALAMIDTKRVEAGLWRPRGRVAVTYDEAEVLAAELKAEMYERLEVMERTGDDLWKPTPERPRITLVVDEGTLIMSGPKVLRADVVELGLAGRAAEIVVWWCTQKPLTSDGPSAGIPTQLAGQMDVRAALKLATPTDCLTVFGNDARGWDAHLQPKPGYLMVRGTGRGPVSIKSWFMTKEQVKSLPERAPWTRAGQSSGQLTQGSGQSSLTKDDRPDTPPEPGGSSNRDKILGAIRFGAKTNADIERVTGINKGTISKTVRRLEDEGLVTKTTDGWQTDAA